MQINPVSLVDQNVQNTEIETVNSGIQNQKSPENLEGCIENLITLRKENLTNPLIGYLNVNSLRGDKIHHIR